MMCPDCRQLRHEGPCRNPLEIAAPDLLKALSELLEQIECLGGVEFSKDLEPYKAEAVWGDANRRAHAAVAKATGEA